MSSRFDEAITGLILCCCRRWLLSCRLTCRWLCWLGWHGHHGCHDRLHHWSHHRWRHDRWCHDDLRSVINHRRLKHPDGLLDDEGMSVLHSNWRQYHCWLLDNQGRLLSDERRLLDDDCWMLLNDDGRADRVAWVDESGVVLRFILKVA